MKTPQSQSNQNTSRLRSSWKKQKNLNETRTEWASKQRQKLPWNRAKTSEHVKPQKDQSSNAQAPNIDQVLQKRADPVRARGGE